jgi:hypothetical protein
MITVTIITHYYVFETEQLADGSVPQAVVWALRTAGNRMQSSRRQHTHTAAATWPCSGSRVLMFMQTVSF